MATAFARHFDPTDPMRKENQSAKPVFSQSRMRGA